MGSPHRWTRPVPAVITRTWPRGCVCHAVRAPGSKVTVPAVASEGASASNSISTRTLPEKFCAGADRIGREPPREMTSD